ncbi:MAG: (2Fe-2S) ferredoxin domain-containing protein [Hormoscilla sp. SP5CHS1]|nr:(2Fe-2S) ferredoxin domain-containing protein [Hormoscilla sp. SP5CHS1]
MDKLETRFNLEGQFLGFGLKDGYKIKYLRLATAEGEDWIKMDKRLRAALYGHSFTLGDWIQVSGEQKFQPKTGQFKLKADRVLARSAPPGPRTAPTPVKAKHGKARVLVCQKSDCGKRGSLKVCQALESALCASGLADRVEIQKTGCLKNCSSGPNLVVMPDKTRYSRIRPREIPALIEKHFSPRTGEPKTKTSQPASILRRVRN